MNAGMYGMSDGSGGTKALIGMAGAAGSSGYGVNAINATTAAACAGLAQSSFSPVATVPLRVLSINGKGALKLLSICDSTSAGTNTWAASVKLDGVEVVNATWGTSTSALYGPALVGSSAATGSASSSVFNGMDYLPFSKSLEVWVTCSGTAANSRLLYLADIYQ